MEAQACLSHKNLGIYCVHNREKVQSAKCKVRHNNFMVGDGRGVRWFMSLVV